MSATELRKAVIKNSDMSEEMQGDAVDCATQALEKYNIEKDIAAYIKKEFDKKVCWVLGAAGAGRRRGQCALARLCWRQVAVRRRRSPSPLASPLTDAITPAATPPPPIKCTLVLRRSRSPPPPTHTHTQTHTKHKHKHTKQHNPTWHCIVGRNFGSYVTHETKHFIYFYLGQVAVLLFKSG